MDRFWKEFWEGFLWASFYGILASVPLIVLLWLIIR